MKSSRIFIIFTFLLAFVVYASPQDVKFPNELKGFEFFGKGRLKDLKLGSSTRKDIEAIFGKSCEEYCDYDDDFKVKIEYLKALDDCMTTKDIRDRAMCPLDNFVGTISAVKLVPKRDRNLVIPTSDFNIITGGSSTEKESGVSISYTSFTDKYGLRYSIKNQSSGNITLYSHYPSSMEGKLHSIEYIFTDDLIRKVFTVEYRIRKKELNN